MTQYIKDSLLDKLEYCELNFDNIKDSYELALKLWESENIDGSITYNTYDAEQWISMYFSDLRDWIGEYKDEFGCMDLIDPFNNPEGFMVCIVIYISYRMLSQVYEESITKEELMQKIQEEF